MKRGINKASLEFLKGILEKMQIEDITQTVLAKRLGVSRPYVTKVLSGDVNISFQTAAKFAKALHMDFAPELTEGGAACAWDATGTQTRGRDSYGGRAWFSHETANRQDREAARIGAGASAH